MGCRIQFHITRRSVDTTNEWRYPHLDKCRGTHGHVADQIDRHFEECFAPYNFPPSRRSRLRTTNGPDKLNKMPSTMIPVGHPARRRFRRALLLSLAISTAFTVFAVMTTQNQSMRAHSPWQDDPYDALVSSTMLFTPLVAAISLSRALLCRAEQGLPAARFQGLLRSTDFVVATVLVTVALDWIAVVTEVHAADWGTTGRVLIAALAVLSLMALGAADATARVHFAASDVVPRYATTPDWCDDLLELASRGARRLGPLEPSTKRLLELVSVHGIEGRRGLRQHRLGAALLVSTAVGVLVFGGQVLREGIGNESVGQVLGTFTLLAVVGTTGMFTMLVAAGKYLNIVRPLRQPGSSKATSHIGRAALVSAASVPFTLAFRDNLNWLIPRAVAQQSLAQLFLLIAVIAAASGICAFTAILGVDRLGSR